MTHTRICVLGLAILAAHGADASRSEERALAPVRVTEEALRIHRSALLVDGHNDLPWQYRDKKDLSFNRIDIARHQKELHTDIPRLRAGGVGAQFWSAYVPAETMQAGMAVEQTLEQIDVIQRMVRRYPETFAMAYTADDIVRIHRSGKIASLIGVEGGHSIANSLAILRSLYALGARYLTLTHTNNVDWADSATDEPKNHGLSPFGEQVIQEMNRLGMMVDISHVSPDTMRHALRISKAPVIASHSSAYAICPSPRNIPDDVLELIRKNDGIVMVNFYSGFLVPEAGRLSWEAFRAYKRIRAMFDNEEEFRVAWTAWKKEHAFPVGTVHTLVDHIDHIVKVAGVDHVGLGSDYDGVTTLPKQLEDVSCYPYVTQELLNRGYKEEQVRKILGGNLLRVMRAVEKAAAQEKD